MNLIEFLRLIDRNLLKMMLAAIVAGATVFYLTRNAPKEYETHTILNTGLVTGYNIERSGGGRIDYGLTNNEMENILGIIRSHATLQDLSTQILAQCLMLNRPVRDTLWSEGFVNLREEIPNELREKIVVPNSYERTLSNVIALRDSPEKNPVKNILTGGHRLFGVESYEKMTVRREGNTDMIRIAWTTTDPAVCRNAIIQLTGLVVERYRGIKEGQSSNVLEFFEKATREAAAALNGKEDEVLNFMVANKIINYYEQTRFIAAKKEDLDELYFKELMTLAAADSIRRGLENKLAGRVELPSINNLLIGKRNELSNISAQMAALEISTTSAADSSKSLIHVNERAIRELQSRSEKIKGDIRRAAESAFAVQRTPDGIETKNLLTEWLGHWITVEQTLARLNVLADRKHDFDITYSRFAPWGSRLKRLEREIDVAERAYLENLHSYNQARLHKYNVMMSANLRVVDAPIFPDAPLPSKRAMTVIMAAVGAALLVLVFYIARELMDQTLRDPERAAVKTGLAIAGAFPLMPENWQGKHGINFPILLRRCTDTLVRQIRLDLRELDIVRPSQARVAIVSPRSGEGKTTIGDWIGKKLPPSEAVCVEIPSLLTGNYNFDDLQGADYALLVARADRTWNAADQRAADIVSKITGKPCKLVLNMAPADRLENIVGEIPKKRSPVRRWLKKLSSFNFK